MTAAAVVALVASLGAGVITGCSPSGESASTSEPQEVTGVTAPELAVPQQEAAPEPPAAGPEIEGKVRAPAPDSPAVTAAPTTVAPPANPQPNPQVQVEVAPGFPKSVPIPKGDQVQANTSPPGTPPESSASLVVGQELTAAVGNYETQLKSAGWSVTEKVAESQLGVVRATRSNAQLTAIFSTGETLTQTVIQISVKGDAG